MDWSLIVSVFAAGISIYVYFNNKKYSNDKELASLSNIALQNAFTSLTNKSDAVPPQANRLNWLTAARQIEQHKFFCKKIKTQLYKDACFLDSEIWSLKFFKTLDMYNIKHQSYYQHCASSGENAYSSPGLEPRSIAVIYDFAINGGGEDPMDKVDLEKLVKEKGILDGNYGLKMYFEQSDAFHEIISRSISQNDASEWWGK